MSNLQNLTSCFLVRSRYSDLTKALEGDDYKFTNSNPLATLAIFPNGRSDQVHFAFININADWSFDEMTQALLRAAPESDDNPTEGYSVIKSLKVGTGPMWREQGFQCLNPVVEERNFRELFTTLKGKSGSCLLIADMEGEEVDRWGGLRAEMMG